jgi:hypothetical protein
MGVQIRCSQRPGYKCVLVNPWQAVFRLAWRSYRICCDVDALLFAVGNQVVVSEERVTLDLVGGRDDTGGIDDGL